MGRPKRGQLVSWVEKANLECIRRLLEITEGKHNHELLLYVKNLWKLGAIPFSYIVPVIPCSLPAELVRGEHFTLADLLKSILGSSAQEGSTQKPQAEAAQETSATFPQPYQLPLDEQDSRYAPQAGKKKKKKSKIITIGTGLEGFVDWVDPNASDPAKEREDSMSRLAAGFAAQMCKRAASAQGETTLDSEVSNRKCPKRSCQMKKLKRVGKKLL